MDRADRQVAALDHLLELTVVLGGDMTGSLAREGLTVPRATLLWVLRAHGPATQRALADALDVSARNVTGLVDALAETGFVVRSPHPTDRRATLVTLTGRGSAVVERMAREQRELAAALFGEMPDERFTVLAEGLGEVVGRLQALVAAGAAS
ncbi:MarR family transcriptional regulator [Blastococcus sp. SYSU D00820]